jgi:hypothetical protein
MHFEGRLASGPDDICDLFAKFIQQTNTDDVWIPSDCGSYLVPYDPHFGALQFRVFCWHWMSANVRASMVYRPFSEELSLFLTCLYVDMCFPGR